MEAEVAPLVGAWIEITRQLSASSPAPVAPLVGAWIEISVKLDGVEITNGRSPRGSVD